MYITGTVVYGISLCWIGSYNNGGKRFIRHSKQPIPYQFTENEIFATDDLGQEYSI